MIGKEKTESWATRGRGFDKSAAAFTMFLATQLSLANKVGKILEADLSGGTQVKEG